MLGEKEIFCLFLQKRSAFFFGRRSVQNFLERGLVPEIHRAQGFVGAIFGIVNIKHLFEDEVVDEERAAFGFWFEDAGVGIAMFVDEGFFEKRCHRMGAS